MKKHAMKGYLLTALAFLILCLVFNIDILTVGMKREFQYVLLHSFQIIYTLIIVLLVFLLYICEKNISESKLWLVDLTMFVHNGQHKRQSLSSNVPEHVYRVNLCSTGNQTLGDFQEVSKTT